MSFLNHGKRASTLQIIVVFILTLHLALPITYLILLLQHGPVENDWAHLKRVADHFVAGDTARLYDVGPNGLHPKYFWRYPPFALYLVAPLAWLTAIQSYLVLALGGIAAWVYASLTLRRLIEREQKLENPLAWFAAIALSPPALSTAVMGQSGGLIVLLVVVALEKLVKSQHILGWALLGLFAVKPNWGVFFGVYALARGAYRGLVAMAAVVGLLCAIPLPHGRELWMGFVDSALKSDAIVDTYPSYRLITLRAVLQEVFGNGGDAMWLVATMGLLFAAVVVWRGPGSEPRKMASTILLAVAANPYASFYDALVLLIPGTVWWSERGRMHAGYWHTIMVLLSTIWISEHLAFSWRPLMPKWAMFGTPPFSLVGPACALWLVIEAVETRRRCQI